MFPFSLDLLSGRKKTPTRVLKEHSGELNRNLGTLIIICASIHSSSAEDQKCEVESLPPVNF